MFVVFRKAKIIFVTPLFARSSFFLALLSHLKLGIQVAKESPVIWPIIVHVFIPYAI